MIVQLVWLNEKSQIFEDSASLPRAWLLEIGGGVSRKCQVIESVCTIGIIALITHQLVENS